MKLNETSEKTITSEKIESWRYPRFFSDNIGETVMITGSDAAHISRVLRMKRGDIAVVCDCRGTDLLCRIITAGESAAELEIIGRRRSEGEPDVCLRLFQCMPKSDKMDFIVQKAVELGAAEVIPVISKRCVSRPDEKGAAKKRERWQRIAEEAAKQCGRGLIPRVGEMISFSDAAARCAAGDGTGIFFYECGGVRLCDIPGLADKKEINVLIGPEGGFEPHEAELAAASGLVTAGLGKRILRCETAPVASIAILMNITGNM